MNRSCQAFSTILNLEGLIVSMSNVLKPYDNDSVVSGQHEGQQIEKLNK